MALSEILNIDNLMDILDLTFLYLIFCLDFMTEFFNSSVVFMRM